MRDFATASQISTHFKNSKEWQIFLGLKKKHTHTVMSSDSKDKSFYESFFYLF